MVPEGPWGEWFRIVAYALFSAFAGVMGHLMRTLDAKEKISWGRASLEGGAAAFVGYIVLQLCSAINLSESWTGVVVGVCGWLGANATIRLLEKVVTKKLGIAIDTAPKSNVEPEEDDSNDMADRLRDLDSNAVHERD